MNDETLRRAIAEVLPGGSGRGRTAPKVLTLRCRQCALAHRRSVVLGIVFSTSVGPLLRCDRHGMRTFTHDLSHGGVKHTATTTFAQPARADIAQESVPSQQPAGRMVLRAYWLLSEPFTPEVEARWFAVCQIDGRRQLPALADLADAARRRRVRFLDI